MGILDKINQGMNSPMTQLGMNILAANTGHYGALAPALGQGFQSFQQQRALQQQAEAQRKFQEMQMKKMQHEMGQTQKRVMKEDRNGILRYVDTGEPVFPNVKAEVGANPFDKDIFSQEKDLRKEFDAETKDFGKLNTAYGKIRAAAQNPTAAGDMAMIFSFMKVLDPGSTVREGEYASAKNAGGWDDRIRAMYNSAVDGKILTVDQRNDFMARSGDLYNTALANYEKKAAQYTALSKSYGLDPSRTIMNRAMYPKYERPSDFTIPPPLTANPQAGVPAPASPSSSIIKDEIERKKKRRSRSNAGKGRNPSYEKYGISQ